MAYTQQIRILEAKLKQIEKAPWGVENTSKILTIQTEIRRLHRLMWEEKYERLKLEEDR